MVVFIFKAKIVTGGDARFPVTTLTFCADIVVKTMSDVDLTDILSYLTDLPHKFNFCLGN